MGAAEKMAAEALIKQVEDDPELVQGVVEKLGEMMGIK